ncbi:hypothetical protein EMIHUDRAFT_118610 [Emiliania huxleyi CCMP1516]|uniref:Methyltransferase domain-containing protein n=2 Tax=Emiliania huxleyi TaxID=2903 RepID=A0A0D3J186_EMIH1|nr:hypothetical protein EMIHUDRAFT_118610 [Emiliania huxleyi CCMP1516]EOD17271.1 hypothetical protein EMIHUDRAFT_118610 [Emiliania huxleyi CCMP1516]|eukprot:XP_005769700.1 hypothetical protein EMIHUDRAFT_118610 [Emiliania huxleyi CCMP1516]
MRAPASTADAVRDACRATLEDYASVAEGYARGNLNHDVSQNIDALLRPLAGLQAPLDILDVCSASGRDLVAFTQLGHRAVGLDGVPAFCRMSREASGCEVWEQDLCALDLPAERFDGIFCNACLFHLPRAALPGALASLRHALRPHGVLFVSNAHGFGQDKEGWTDGRTATTRSYVCWLSEETWLATCEAAGLSLLDKFYRPPGRARAHQPFLATVWRKEAAPPTAAHEPRDGPRERLRLLAPVAGARSIDAVPPSALDGGRELTMVVLHDRAQRRVLLRVPNALGWRLHFGCAGSTGERGDDASEAQLCAAAKEAASAALADAGVALASPRLRLAGLMLFSFPPSSAHAPMRVRVLEATPNLAAEQPAAASPCSVDAVPYEQMWADDKIWMPHLLARADSYFEAHFVFDGPPGAASRVVDHNWDPACRPPEAAAS